MKKFLAILLASIMVFALATPAMATTATTALTFPTSGELTLEEGDAEQIGYLVYNLGDNETLVVESSDTAVVTTRTCQSTYCIIDAVSTGTANIWVYVNDPDGNQVLGSKSIVTVTVTPAATDTTVNSINATIDAKVGDKVFDTVPTYTADPEDSVTFDNSRTLWLKWAIGTDPGDGARNATTVEKDEVFEAGYNYICGLYFVPKAGYVFVDATTALYINSDEDFFLADSDDVIKGEYVFTFDAAPEETTTTVAETTTATTTTASTGVKTGDSSNMTIYVIALIALVAAAGVTIFATKKSK